MALNKNLDTLFKENIMETLGEAFVYAEKDHHIDLDAFMSFFIKSGFAKRFEDLDPSVVYGRSGAELVLDVMNKIGIHLALVEPSSVNDSIESFWCGFVLAYYQLKTGASFARIHSLITMKDVKKMFYPLHEADEDRFVEELNKKLKIKITRLQKRRLDIGLSQSQLAKASNVNLRTLQQYEIGAKDINKASALTVYNLSKSLMCDVGDILELI